LQKKVSQTFSEKRKKGSGFHDRKKASFEKSEGKFAGEKKVLLIENQRVENPSVLAKRVDLNPVAKTFQKKF